MHNIIGFEKNIYVLGGKTDNDSKSATSSVEKIEWDKIKPKYDLICDINDKSNKQKKETSTTVKWSEVEPFYNFRYNAMVFVYNYEFYLFGGIERSDKICKKVEKYNVSENHWYNVNWKMPFKIHSAKIINLNQQEILLIGGEDYNGGIDSILKINFDFKKYIFKASCSARINPKILKKDLSLYILGGDSDTSCEKINLKNYEVFIAGESYKVFLNDSLSSFPESEVTCVLKSPSDIDNVIIQLDKNFDNIENFDINEEPLRNFIFGNCKYPFIAQIDLNNEKFILHEVYFNFKLRSHGKLIRINNNFAISFGGNSNSLFKASKGVQLINLDNFQSKKLNKMKIGKVKFEIVKFYDKIYVIGGLSYHSDNTENYLKNCDCYSIKDNSWNNLNPMLNSRINFSSIINQNLKKIYTFGGNDGLVFLDSIEEFDIVNNKWVEHKLALPEICCFHKTYYFEENLIILLGGENSINNLNEVWVLNLQEKRKKVLCKLFENRIDPKIIKNNNNLLIFGGNKTCFKIEVFRLDKLDMKKDLYKSFNKFINEKIPKNELLGYQVV